MELSKYFFQFQFKLSFYILPIFYFILMLLLKFRNQLLGLTLITLLIFNHLLHFFIHYSDTFS